MSGDSPSRQNASMFYGQNDRPTVEGIQRLRRDRSPRREQMFAPGWHGAAQVPVPVEINTPRGGMTHEERHATEAAVTQLAAGVMSTEEIISRLEVHADHTVAAVKSIEGKMLGMAGTVQSASDTISKIEEALVNMLTQLTGTQSNFEAFKQQMTSSLTRAEGTLSTSLNGLAHRVSQTENMLKQMERAMSNQSSNLSSSSPGSTNFIPLKNMMPAKFGNKVEIWREWQEDVRGFFDGTRPGIREALQSLENEDEEQGTDFIRREYPGVAAEGQALWRALKISRRLGLTQDE